MIFRPLVLLTVLLGLTACETAPSATRLLSKQEQAALGNVDGIVSITQTQPDITITPTGTPGAGGLAGLLIFSIADGFRQAHAEKEGRVLIAAMQDFSFKEAFFEAATSKLSALPGVKITMRPEVNTAAAPEATRRLYEESHDASVLFVSARLALNSGDLVLTASASIFPKASQLMPLRPKPNDANPLAFGNAIYRDTVTAVRKSVTPDDIRARLTEAINEVTDKLAADLERTRPGS